MLEDAARSAMSAGARRRQSDAQEPHNSIVLSLKLLRRLLDLEWAQERLAFAPGLASTTQQIPLSSHSGSAGKR